MQKAEDVAGVEAVEELEVDGRVVGALLAFGEVLPAPMGVVEHAHDAHEREAATLFLGGGLRVFGLVFLGVVKGHGAAIN